MPKTMCRTTNKEQSTCTCARCNPTKQLVYVQSFAKRPKEIKRG